MTEPSRQAAGQPVPRRGLALVIAFGVIVVGTWLHKRSPGVDAAQPESQAPVGQAASNAAPALPAHAASLPPALAASAMLALPGKPASARASQASAPQRHSNSVDTQLIAQLRSPADALRKVQLALGGGTPKEVLEAAQTLEGCKSQAQTLSDLHALRDRPDEVPESLRKTVDEVGGITQVIEVAEVEARRCQAFDSATMARRRELFQRAYGGGAEGSAAAYLRMLRKPEEKATADPALVARLQADVRKAAVGGEADALLYLAMAPDDHATELGVTTAQRAGYKAAWKAIQDERSPGWAATFEKFMPPAASLSAAQQDEADALAQQVLEAWRRKHKSG